MNLITGDKFKNLPGIEFTKIDDIDRFNPPLRPYILVTHNGDLSITRNHNWILEDKNLIKWFGINTTIEHPKLITIPIGINYEDKTNYDTDMQIRDREEAIHMIMEKEVEKKWLISKDANLRIRNLSDRLLCESALKRNGLKNVDSYLFGDYLMNLKRSMFAVAPAGFGIDTFRLWECLYMKCIPIISSAPIRGCNKDLYKGLPILWIDSWEDFKVEDLSEELYDNIWFESEKTNFDFWAKKIKECVMS